MEETLNVILHDVDYIPDYRIAEEQRQANEVTRQANEIERQEYYEEIQEKVNNGDFNGKDGTNGIDGKDGINGIDGENGATFTPSVSSDGDLSWSNDKGLPNPATMNIKGPQGNQGIQGIPGAPGAQGEPGANGPANVLSIGTVESGEEASASITGESPEQILNLVLPRGKDAKTYIWDGSTGDEAKAMFKEILQNIFEDNIVPYMYYKPSTQEGYFSLLGIGTLANTVYFQFARSQFTGSAPSTYGVSYTEIKQSRAYITYDNEYNVTNITRNGDYSTYILGSNNKILGIGNTQEFIPTKDYEPSTKKYVDDNVKGCKPIYWDGTMDEEGNALAMFQEAYDYYLETGVIKNIQFKKVESNGKVNICPLININVSSTEAAFVFASLNGTPNTYTNPTLKYYNYRFDISDGTLSYYVAVSYDSFEFKVAHVYEGNNVAYGGCLEVDNNNSYTPTDDYNPATKKYVDDAIAAAIAQLQGNTNE